MDDIDQAIAATAPQHERRVRMEPKLPSGRVAIVDVPADMTIDDFRALVSWVAVDMPRSMAGASGPPAPIVDRVAQLRAIKNGN